MSIKEIYCFNPFCGKRQPLEENNPTKCTHCKEESLKLGGIFYAVKINKKKDIVKSFVAQKCTEQNNNFFIKVTYSHSRSETYTNKINNYGNLANNNYTNPKKESELDPPLRKLKTELPESIPSIEEIHFNYFCTYVVSKRINGKNLKVRIRDEKPLTREHLLQMFESIATALKKIHDRGIIHGDIKPENIIFSEKDNGKIFFVDPLVAKSFNEDKHPSYIPNTPYNAYISPNLQEYLSEPHSEDINYVEEYTKSDDIYAISALFIKILSNQISNENDGRSDDGIWRWSIGIDGIDNIDSLKELLDKIVAKSPGYRNRAKVDELIDCIVSLQKKPEDNISSSPKNRELLNKFITSIPQLKWLGEFRDKLNQAERDKPIVKILTSAATLIIIFGGGAWAVVNLIVPLWLKNSPPPTKTQHTSPSNSIYKLTEEQLKPLQDALSPNSPNFKQGDILTHQLLLELFKRERVNLTSTIKFNQVNITNNKKEVIPVKRIPEYCADLERIDKLWRSASNNNFGFKAQKEIVDNMKFSNTRHTAQDKRTEDFYAKQVKSLGWGELNQSDFDRIEKIRSNNQLYEIQRDEIIKVIQLNGGFSDIDIKSPENHKGYYPITVKLGTTENWPNFSDWCSPDYESRRKTKLDN